MFFLHAYISWWGGFFQHSPPLWTFLTSPGGEPHRCTHLFWGPCKPIWLLRYDPRIPLQAPQNNVNYICNIHFSNSSSPTTHWSNMLSHSFSAIAFILFRACSSMWVRYPSEVSSSEYLKDSLCRLFLWVEDALVPLAPGCNGIGALYVGFVCGMFVSWLTSGRLRCPCIMLLGLVPSGFQLGIVVAIIYPCLIPSMLYTQLPLSIQRWYPACGYST